MDAQLRGWALRRSRWLLGLSGIVAISAVWILVATRTVPDKEYDRGIFVSVAERLRAGDRLYVDVWDNKDPLFFWALALARSMGGPFGDIGLEVLWLVTGCTAAFVVARGLGTSTVNALLASAVSTPLLLTGSLYSPGATHLPGIALTLWAVGAGVRGHPFASGVLVTCAAAVKLLLIPIALALALVAIWRRGGARPLGNLALGVLAGAAGFAALLGARGEFLGYLRTQALNFGYAKNPVLVDAESPLASHLRRGLGIAGFGVFAFICVVVLVSFVLDRRATDLEAGDRRDTALLRELTAVAVLLGMVTVIVTGLWPHHAQTLYIAAVLCVLLIARHLTMAQSAELPSAVALACAGVLLSGTFLPRIYDQEASPASVRLADLTRPSPETAALLAEASSGRYARLGTHDERGHAEGLAGWTLACPRFHQYPWDSAASLDEVLSCANGQPYLIVSDGIATEDDPRRFRQWNAFVAEVEDLLGTSYECTRFEGGRVCQLR